MTPADHANTVPYYQDDWVTIYHGDCREILPTVRADLIITSPPYNRGSRVDENWQGITTASCKSSRFRDGYGETTDDMPWDIYRDWLRETMALVWGSCNGAMWFNHKPRIVNGRLWMPTETLAGMPLRQIIVWDTGPGVNTNPGAFTPAHEWVMLVAHPGWRLAHRTSGTAGDVWRIQPATSTDHPAPFPSELVARCLVASPPGTILDPFMGSGTTLRTAKDHGRKAIGIELEERYCEQAANRCSQEVLPITTEVEVIEDASLSYDREAFWGNRP